MEEKPEVKPEAGNAGGNDEEAERETQISIGVKREGHDEVTFKIKKKTKMAKVISSYCQVSRKGRPRAGHKSRTLC